jgi:DNA-binding NarL/FixJ family response regulator
MRAYRVRKRKRAIEVSEREPGCGGSSLSAFSAFDLYEGCPPPRNGRVRTSQATDSVKLTARQKQVCLKVAEAKSNQQIAADLGLTRRTVTQYLHRIFRQIGVANRTELALLVIRSGIQDETGEITQRPV